MSAENEEVMTENNGNGKTKQKTPTHPEDAAIARVSRELRKSGLSAAACSRVIDAVARRFSETKEEQRSQT